MTPDDLRTVECSWAELAQRRDALLGALTRRYEALASTESTIPAAVRADWLLGAVESLVAWLAQPSRLTVEARVLGQTWPDPHTAPSFAIDGRAWLDAAGDCAPSWSNESEVAWRQAWLLLSDLLAAEALSPFMDDPLADRRPSPTGEGRGTTPSAR